MNIPFIFHEKLCIISSDCQEVQNNILIIADFRLMIGCMYLNKHVLISHPPNLIVHLQEIRK